MSKKCAIAWTQNTNSLDFFVTDAKWLEGKTAKKNRNGITEVEPTPGKIDYYSLDGFSRLSVSRESGEEKTKVRPDYSFAPTQLALCLRLAYSDLKGESCYAPS